MSDGFVNLKESFPNVWHVPPVPPSGSASEYNTEVEERQVAFIGRDYSRKYLKMRLMVSYVMLAMNDCSE